MTDRVPLFDDDPVFILEIISICKDIRDGAEGFLDIAPSLGILFNPSSELLAMIWFIIVQRNVPSLPPALPSDQRTSVGADRDTQHHSPLRICTKSL